MVCGYGELEVRRIFWSTRGELGWPVAATAVSWAAAGAWLVAGAGLQQAGERVERLGGLLEAPGV